MSEPKRIQRKRSKGWRMPDGAVYVGRPGVFGNPFDTAEEFRAWLDGRMNVFELEFVRNNLLSCLHELRGKHVACWCPLDCPCHADVLLEFANR